MEQVWVTRAGSRYHAEVSCPALADGHAKAAAEGRANYSPELLPLNRVRHQVSPCARCWPARSEWDEWKQLEHQTIRLGDSNFEYEFLHRVLKHVRGIDPAIVRVQEPVVGSAGQNFRVDFALLPPGGPKIAIEIDGFDKVISGSVATKEHQDQDSSRRSELTIAGWQLLSFTNRQVQTESGECRRKIENLLLQRATSVLTPVAGSWSAPAASRVDPWSSPAPSRPPRTVSAPTNPSRRSSAPWVVGVIVAAVVIAGAAWILGSNEGAGGESVIPEGRHCPSGYPVKGNITDDGEKIYHEPGWRYYYSTWPERCFADVAAAEQDGYRASKVQ